MRICFIADARSAIARNWIEYFIGRRHDVHVISSYRCDPNNLPGASLYQVPVAFGGFAGVPGCSISGTPVVGAGRRFLRTVGTVSQGSLRMWLAPLDLFHKAARFREMLRSIRPDLVHAMRIPFEGMAASMASSGYPLLISCWGNDFDLWARSLPGRILTAGAVGRAQAFHCDSEKDMRLVHQWGFPRGWPALVAPGAGGIQIDKFHPAASDAGEFSGDETIEIPRGARVVINPRGARIYVRNDVFFEAIPRVLNQIPEAFFLCPALASDQNSIKTVARLRIGERVKLLPAVDRSRMAALFRAAEVSVSPSDHDGTPNTLLEAMASGCFPIAGNIESVREWIADGVNGLLYDCADTAALARAIVTALRETDLRARAARHNLSLVRQRAEYTSVMARAEEFYREVISSCSAATPAAITGRRRVWAS